MTRAPLAQQRKLLDLQAHDNAAARLQHERKTLPALSKIEQTIASLKANKRDAVVAAAALTEAKAEATRREDELSQVERRAAILRERLSSGSASARDLSAIQGEIDQLGRRQGVLEEAQLEAMEALEAAQKAVDDIATGEQEIRARGREYTAQRDADFARIDAELARLVEQRAALVGEIGEELLADYESVKAQTGGVGVAALYGRRVEGASIDISPQEFARIQAADLEEVLHSEDGDIILVRMSED